MKKKLCESLMLSGVLLFLCFCHMANRPGEPTHRPTVTSIPSSRIDATSSNSPSLQLSAAGACVMDVTSGRILYGKSENESFPMASTTKIMTCLLALEQGTLTDTVTFSSNATSMPKVHLGASKETAFSLEDLLYSLMLESHNDSAVAIAEHIGGSVEGFATLMNAKAQELGMNQTQFVTPNGLDADGHSSTPADMCRLASYACANEAFLSLIQTPSKTIHDTTGRYSYSLTNHDAFLHSYSGALGMKTGFTNKAGYCFVGAARQNQRTLVSCVLASGWPPNKSWKWADTKALMDYGFKHFSTRVLPEQDLSSFYINVENGKADLVGIAQPKLPSLLLADFDTISFDYKISPSLIAPVKQDVPLGTLTISINDNPCAVLSLYPKEPITEIEYSDVTWDVFQRFLAF